MKSFNEETIKLFNKTILEDEFNDKYQNDDIYDGFVSGGKEMIRLLNTDDLMRELDSDDIPRHVLNVGAGQADLRVIFPPNTKIFDLEPCPQRKTVDTIEGWSENIEGNSFDVVVCWGVLCFVRSLPETLIEFNHILYKGGNLITDVVEYSTMPLPQTVNPDNFVRWINLFGFELEERIKFGNPYHKRVGYRFTKFEEFNHKRFLMPQCEGKINNFLPERDWFLK
jgi:hypothetical protein